MAEFKRSLEENEMVKGETEMDNGTGLGTGVVGGLIVGGLAGWAFSRDRGCGYGYGPYPYAYGAPIANGASFAAGVAVGENAYSLADVSNLVATKDAQYAQLNATQQTRYDILNTMSRDNTAMAKDLCGLAYEVSNLNGQTQRQIAEVSAKADLCCCETQGLIKQNTTETQGLIAQSTAQTQGMIASIVPQMQNFYLKDEVEKLRIKELASESACQYNSLHSQLNLIGAGVAKLIDKSTTTTTGGAAA